MKQVTINTPFITLIVLDYGAIIQKILVKDKDGNSKNVVAGFNFPKKYLNDSTFLGACIGRFAGRISNGGFEIDRKKYDIHHQNGVHLHGGKEGFGKKYWTIDEVYQGREPFVTLSYQSKHLEEGYPGNLKATVTYKLVNNALIITHKATTDLTTIVNLTNHSYFNLDDSNTINHYDLAMNCPEVIELTSNQLPTGKLLPVKNTPFDFLQSKPIDKTHLDTPFIVSKNGERAVMVSSKKSGISMQVHTNQPVIVVYTPKNLAAICFETQNYPDGPNRPNFPDSILRPNEQYKNESSFIFDLL